VRKASQIATTLLLTVLLLAPWSVAEAATKSKRSEYIVRLKPSVSLSSFLVTEIRGGLEPLEVFSTVFPGFLVKLDAKSVRRLSSDRRVAAVSKVNTFSVPRSPEIGGIGYVWGIDRIDQRSLPMDRVFTPPSAGSGVTVFVIDTGVDKNHPELVGRVRTGFSAVDPSDGTSDCNGHGTHVAATIGGTKVGVASGVTIVPIKVFPCKSGASTATILKGIDAVLQLRRPGTATVVNMSLGGPLDLALDAAVRALVDEGITVVVAAGNENSNACGVSPAREPRVITVGATDQSDARARFSNLGSCVDVFAPGENILSAWPGGQYASLNGTSMAAPHVAGAAALLLESNSGLRPADVESLITGRASLGSLTNVGQGSPNRLLFLEPRNQPPVTTTSTTVAARTASAPRNLQFVVSGNDVTLLWAPPLDSGGSLVSDYVVDYWPRGGSRWIRFNDSVSASTFLSIRGLSTNVYSFRVAAVNLAGIGQFVQSADLVVGTSTTTTTVVAGAPSLDSDSLSKSSMTLQSDINSNSISWTVRVRDPFGGRLSSSQVGARLCPVSSSWPDGAGCTGATAIGSGNSLDRTYTFLFLIAPAAPTGQWLPRMFGPVSGQPDIIGNARVSVSGPTTTTSSTTTTSTTTTTVAPGPGVAQILSESLSVSSIALRGSQASDNAVWWTVRVRDPQGRLASSVGGQLCPPGSSYPFGNWCTGATFGRSGSSSEATYQGLFWISPDAPGGDWIPRFDPIPGGVTVTGTARVRVIARGS